MKNKISLYLKSIEKEINKINYLLNETQKELQLLLSELQVKEME